VETLACRILTHLRDMDREAVPREGKPTGLWWYGRHARPELRRPSTEVAWTAALTTRLGRDDYAVEKEVPYPDRRRDRCDLVVQLPDGRRVWVEVKGAWKDYWLKKGGVGIFRSYLLHPLVPFPSMGKTHTAALDLVKLERLGPDVANIVAFVLIGFDTADAPLAPEFVEFTSRAQLGCAPWTGAADSWHDAQGRGVHVRLWWRPTSR
jgi:hypothetical protein